MEFVIPNGEISCECLDFVKDLLKLSKKLFTIEDERLQWTLFEKFMFKQLRTRKRSRDYSLMTCSLNISSYLLSKTVRFRRSGMTPSILLLNMMSSIYFKNCRHFGGCLFWDLQKKNSFPSDVEHIRVFGAFRGNLEFIKLLANFGFLETLPEDSHRLRTEASAFIFNFMVSISSPGESFEFDFEAFTNLLKKCSFPIKEDGQIYKRMFFVGIALHATAWSLHATHHNLEHDEAENFIECLRLYFTATCDPFLTVYEVRSVLYACCIVLNKEHLFDAYAEEFDNLMPESPANIEPRKLADLARCQIRHNLKMSNVPLPAAVEKLPLPKLLKDFVVGHETDISIIRVNASSKRTLTKSELRALFYQRPVF